ncbi:hypothetical protein E4G67_02035 [Candidatus Bathyarchaeota archaeon]|nr:MAG: hypothetical protein E4G67_02035 [Candidatus Bathyarchaeota archaeon]
MIKVMQDFNSTNGIFFIMSPLQKYTVTDKNVMPWTEKYPTVLNYLSKINSYRERAATDLYLFCEWAGKTPDELLAMKGSFESLEAEKPSR